MRSVKTLESCESPIPRNIPCSSNFLLSCFIRATKGIGRTQPVAWKDAGMALNHVELSGCEMPAGPGQDVPGVPGLYLQYNEVRHSMTCINRCFNVARFFFHYL